MAKRRFGVSMEEELLEKVELLAKLFRTTRSAVLEEAAKNFVLDNLELLSSGCCCGMLIVEGRPSELRPVVDRFKDVVLNHMHVHVGGSCVDVVLVYGDASRIAELRNSLVRELRCATRFVPLPRNIEGVFRGERRAR